MTAWQAEEIRHAIRNEFGPYECLELLRVFNELEGVPKAPVPGPESKPVDWLAECKLTA